MSGVPNRIRRVAGWLSVDGPPSYRDAWRAAVAISLVGAAYAAVYALSDPRFASFVGLAAPLLGVAFTLGVAVERREPRNAGLSLAVLLGWGGAAWAFGPVGRFVAGSPWFGVFVGWLTVLFVLLGYAAPGLARSGEG